MPAVTARRHSNKLDALTNTMATWSNELDEPPMQTMLPFFSSFFFLFNCFVSFLFYILIRFILCFEPGFYLEILNLTSSRSFFSTVFMGSLCCHAQIYIKVIKIRELILFNLLFGTFLTHETY